MPNNVSRLERTGGLGTSMVVGLSIAIPACATTWMQSETWIPLQDWPTYLLSGSLALLAIGIAVKVVKVLGAARPADREARPAVPEPDHSIGAQRNSVLRQYLWGDR